MITWPRRSSIKAISLRKAESVNDRNASIRGATVADRRANSRCALIPLKQRRPKARPLPAFTPRLFKPTQRAGFMSPRAASPRHVLPVRRDRATPARQGPCDSVRQRASCTGDDCAGFACQTTPADAGSTTRRETEARAEADQISEHAPQGADQAAHAGAQFAGRTRPAAARQRLSFRHRDDRPRRTTPLALVR
jgi:hypothetical protein